MLVSGLGWHHYPSRAVSFSLAVTATWLLNRNWVFGPSADTRREYLRYFSIQAVGALINLGTYVTVIETVPRLAGTPVIPLAIGAGLALVFNFLTSRCFVFRPQTREARRQPPDSSSYSGRENLEAMKHAQRYNRFLEDLVQEHALEGPVLDFGAGAGTFAIPLSLRGLDIACIEPDAGLRQILERAGLETHASLGDVPAASVSYIYSLNVLEHIEDDRAMLEALGSRLRAGGRLLLYVPAFEILYSSMDAQVGHFRRYRKKSLAAAIEAAGLRIETARYADSLGFVASLLFRWFGNDTGTLSARSVRLYDSYAFPLSRLIDRLVGPWIGKNLLVVATRPPTQ